MNYDAKIDTGEDGHGVDAMSAFDNGDEEDRRSDRRMWIFAAAAIALLVGLWLFNHLREGEQIGESVRGEAPVVTVLVPGRSTVTGKIGATGTLAARREMPVGIVGEGGRVESVLVEPGEWVKAGQVLAVIDRSVQVQQQASQAAQLQVAQADARLAQANLDRALKLVDRGFISKADVDRLTATRDAAVARVRVASAQLGEIRARNSRLNVVAPAAGLVLDRQVEPGQVVGAGSGVLFRIARGGEMEMLARLSEDDLAKISVGVGAEVTPVGSGRTFSGQVWQISPVIDPQDRQGEARIALPYARELRPGGFASAEIGVGTVVAPRLPESAVLSDDKGSYVYVVGKDNKVQRRDVQTGQITSDGIVIRDGLTGGERIVVRAGAFLAPGETVTPKTPEGS